jgi:hypothetical protein
MGVSGIESHRHAADQLTPLDRRALLTRIRTAEDTQVSPRSTILEHDPPATVLPAVSCSYIIK